MSDVNIFVSLDYIVSINFKSMKYFNEVEENKFERTSIITRLKKCLSRRRKSSSEMVAEKRKVLLGGDN